jgi:hypothetical protein
VAAKSDRKVQVPPVAPRFRVRLNPMQDKTQDEESRAAVVAFRSALLTELQGIRNLDLLTESGEDAANAPFDYQITITGDGSARDNRWSVNVMVASAFLHGTGARTNVMWPLRSVVSPACTGSASERVDMSCSNPSDAATRLVEMLRRMSFPPDAEWRGVLTEQLRDSRLDEQTRFKALNSLRAERMNTSVGADGSTVRIESIRQDIDRLVVQGAVELARSAHSPTIKAQVWNLMRGVDSPELVLPLIRSIQMDADESVRIEAITTLAADHAGDSVARAALESVARDDARPLLRMIAGRSLGAEVSWGTFASATLKDETSSDTQRIEPLVYLAKHDAAQLRSMLDGESIGVLNVVLPRIMSAIAARATPGMPGTSSYLSPLLTSLRGINQPGMEELFMNVLTSSADPTLRQVAVGGLIAWRDDSKVRKVLVDIATNDPDPAVRKMAGYLLPQ